MLRVSSSLCRITRPSARSPAPSPPNPQWNSGAGPSRGVRHGYIRAPPFQTNRAISCLGFWVGVVFIQPRQRLDLPGQPRVTLHDKGARGRVVKPAHRFFAVWPGLGAGRGAILRQPCKQVRGSWRPLASFPWARGVGTFRRVRSRRARGLPDQIAITPKALPLHRQF